MWKRPRGKCLIINVQKVKDMKDRRGTDVDRDALVELCQQLYVDTTVYNDEHGLTAKDIYTKLEDFASHNNHIHSQICMVFILSHGGRTTTCNADSRIDVRDVIYGTDGERVHVRDIMDYFSNDKCSALQGVPKMFIFQACRGGKLKLMKLVNTHITQKLKYSKTLLP